MVIVDEIMPANAALEMEDDEEDIAQENKTADSSHHALTRGEKKARKILIKHGMKLVNGITRVELVRSKAQTFTVHNPLVYQLPGTNTFVVLGLAQFDGYKQEFARQLQIAQKQQQGSTEGLKPTIVDEEPAKSKGAQDGGAGGDGGEIDMTGINEADVELAMSQTSCTKYEAVKALRDCNGDIIEAIMNLSS